MPQINLKSSFRRGFTFTEVMFAVILLGIGFIMLAGMFPVAIQQTQSTVEESISANLLGTATRYLEQTLNQEDLPPTGRISFPAPTTALPVNWPPPPAYPQFLRVSQRYYYQLYPNVTFPTVPPRFFQTNLDLPVAPEPGL